MKTLLIKPHLIVLCWLLTACSLAPTAPTTQLHDFGPLPTLDSAASSVALRQVQTFAHPLVASTAMQYREASTPSRRASYALNRWAAPPAVLLDSALNRSLGNDSTSRCRLNVQLQEFILDINAQNQAHTTLSVNLNLLRDQVSLANKALDIAIPLSNPSPANTAQGFGQASQQLAQAIGAWLNANANTWKSACKG